MSVMTKKFGLGVGRWVGGGGGELYPVLFGIFFNFANPLTVTVA